MPDAVDAEVRDDPWISDDLLLFAHPLRAYARARERVVPGTWTLLRGPLRWLLVVGLFVSLTTAGRLPWYHVLLPSTVWVVFPVLQCAWIVVAARVVGSRAPASIVVDLYFRGHGVWYIVMLAVSAVCLLAPAPSAVLEAALGRGLLGPGLLVLTCVSSAFTYAMLRAGLGLGRVRALIGLGLFTLGYGGAITTWFLFTGQLVPLVID